MLRYSKLQNGVMDMPDIERLEYDNRKKRASDFEIIDLQHFLETRASSHLARDYRLNFWLLMYITGGEGEHFIDFRRYPFKAGDLLIMQKNQVHRFNVNTRATGYIMIFNEPFFFGQDGSSGETLLEFFNSPVISPVLNICNEKGSANRTLADLIYREYQNCRGREKTSLIRSLIQSFILSLDDFLRGNRFLYRSAEFKTYSQFRTLLEQNYRTVKSVNEYAAMMGVTTKTINGATRALADLSAKEFIIQRLILEIKRYLSLGDLLTYEISDRMGFDDPANMAKFFRRYEGVSPSAFKESLNRIPDFP